MKTEIEASIQLKFRIVANKHARTAEHDPDITEADKEFF